MWCRRTCLLPPSTAPVRPRTEGIEADDVGPDLPYPFIIRQEGLLAAMPAGFEFIEGPVIRAGPRSPRSVTQVFVAFVTPKF